MIDAHRLNKPVGEVKYFLLGSGCALGWAGLWRHVEQIVAHPVLELLLLQRVVVHHHHFIFFVLGDGETLSIFVHLMRKEFTKRSVALNVRDGSEQRLFPCLILQGDHE